MQKSINLDLLASKKIRTYAFETSSNLCKSLKWLKKWLWIVLLSRKENIQSLKRIDQYHIARNLMKYKVFVQSFDWIKNPYAGQRQSCSFAMWCSEANIASDYNFPKSQGFFKVYIHFIESLTRLKVEEFSTSNVTKWKKDEVSKIHCATVKL